MATRFSPLLLLPILMLSGCKGHVSQTPTPQAPILYGGVAEPVATARSVLGWFNVAQFGAKGDGTTDDTAAIQAAIDAAGATGGGVVTFPPGTFKVSPPAGTSYCLLLHQNGVKLRGAGIASRIACASTTADTILLGNSTAPGGLVGHCEISGFVFNPSTLKGDQATEIRAPYTTDCLFQSIFFGDSTRGNATSNVGTCFTLGSATSLSGSGNDAIEDIDGFGYYRMLDVAYCIDFTFTKVFGNSNRADSQAIRFSGGSESCMFTDGDLVCGETANNPNLIVQADASGTPRFNRWTNWYFDTSTGAVVVNAGESNHWDHCWMPGNAAPSFSVPANSAANGCILTACELVVANFEGAALLAGSGHQVIGGVVAACGKAGNSAAIRIGAACSGAIVSGVVTSNSLFSARLYNGAATHGLLIEPGAINIVATGNSFNGAGGTSYTAASSLTVVNNQ